MFLQSLGIRNALYIDDLFTLGETEEKARFNNQIAKEVLAKAGWIVHKDKGKGPSRRLRFLGLEVCSVSRKFFIPADKQQNILEVIRELLVVRSVKVRRLASLVGKLQSCEKVIGPVVRLMTRASYLCIMEGVETFGWSGHIKISKECREELDFWRFNLADLDGFLFSPDLSTEVFSFETCSDASGVGFFGFQFVSKYKVLLRRMFNEYEKMQSSTFRELLALRDIFLSKEAENYRGKSVRHLTDNKAVSRIMLVGSKVKELHEMVTSIFLRCRALQIKLVVEWRSREDPLLKHADEGSRKFDQSSFSLNFESFASLFQHFVDLVLEVDCMAENWNKKCDVYFSRFPEAGSSGVNFFAQALAGNLQFYVFPPPSLVTATILHLQKFQVRGLLLVPFWRSASFWNNVVPDGRHLAVWALSFYRFRPSGFVCDPMVTSSTFKNPPNFDILAIRFNFAGVQRENVFSCVPYKQVCLNMGCDECMLSHF